MHARQPTFMLNVSAGVAGERYSKRPGLHCWLLWLPTKAMDLLDAVKPVDSFAKTLDTVADSSAATECRRWVWVLVGSSVRVCVQCRGFGGEGLKARAHGTGGRWLFVLVLWLLQHWTWPRAPLP